jgi:serpin B
MRHPNRLRALFRHVAPVLFASVCAGCAGGGAPSTTGAALAMAKSDLPRDTTPRVRLDTSATLVDGNTAFAVEAYRWLAVAKASSGQNIVVSPYSMSVSLAMAYAGAAGRTATEIAQALHFTLPASDLAAAFDALDLQLVGAQNVALRLANSLWGYTNERYGKAFLDTMAKDYGTGVRLEDFAGDPAGSREHINAWVYDETDRRIANLLAPGAIDSTTRLVLVNAMVFQGRWATPFSASATRVAPFTRDDGTAVNVPTMARSPLSVRVDRTDAYDAVELPYEGGQIALDIVAPKQGSFETFESGLTASKLAAIVQAVQPAEIDLRLPKFAISAPSTSYRPLLEALGMHAAFDPRAADFSGIAVDARAPLYIADVVHAATIDIDEHGTEAAAATGTTVSATIAVRPGQAISIDRPFVFALRDLTSQAVMFLGRVVDPAAGR